MLSDLMTKLDDFKASIERYVRKRVPPGDFLRAVLENDLRESMGRADEGSRLLLFEIVKHCYNDIPGGCWGSPEKVRAWYVMDGEVHAELLRCWDETRGHHGS